MKLSASPCPLPYSRVRRQGEPFISRTGRLALIPLLVSLICGFSPRTVMAFGFGVETGLGFGRLTKSSDYIFSGYESTTSFHETRGKAGFVYDTNVGQDRLFNYRLGISYQKMKATTAEESFDLHGISFDNDFGFALISYEKMRLWIGPEVKVELIEGSYRNPNGESHTSDFALGLAPLVGLNVHLDNDISLCLKGGYMFLEGLRFFSDWEERYGFFTIGIIQKFGGDRPLLKEAKP